jgi:hypothetical protein
MRAAVILATLLASIALRAAAQMQMPMPSSAPVSAQNQSLSHNILQHMESGTDVGPNSSTPPMLMRMNGNWMQMLHGQVIVAAQQQSGPRGADKVFSVNWLMLMVQHTTPRDEWTFRAMFSLEPATISGRYYPELFQQGETAFGKPIIDGQHPHNLFMELAAIYDRNLGENGLATVYAAPVGDPALGPIAYPHRMSAESNPLAPLGHHLEDSTHIAWDVVTGGLTWRMARIEASGFHGREPDENRWHIEVGPINSWSARLTVTPERDVTVQYSLGHLHSPEALHPAEDVLRQTASIAAHHTWSIAEIDATAIWGRNHAIGANVNANGYLFEAEMRLRQRQSLWTRIENDDRTTDLLGPAAPPEETVIGRVQAYTAGYAHRIWSNHWSSLELGAQPTLYTTPSRLIPLYGAYPYGVAGLLHWRIGR